MFNFEDIKKGAVIKVIGVGGAGGNAVTNMINAGVEGVEFIVANTDAQVLSIHQAPVKIHLGRSITRGLGAGGNPEVGKKAAIEDIETITECLRGADIVFVTAGMGGGTGTGAAPVIARIAKDLGALTIAVVTKPFSYEAAKRRQSAQYGIKQISEHVDSYLIVENDKIIDASDKTTSFLESYIMVDDVLRHGVQGISDTINKPGYTNLDVADLRTAMVSKGMALMGVGIASGENRDREAVERALKGPLLADVNIQGAFGIIYNITAGRDLSRHEVANIGNLIHQAVGDDAETFEGVSIDETMTGSIKVVIVATGLGLSKPDKTVKMEDYLVKQNPEIKTRLEKSNKRLSETYSIEDGNRDDKYEIPTFLRKQVD